jgi:hypothetical protein
LRESAADHDAKRAELTTNIQEAEDHLEHLKDKSEAADAARREISKATETAKGFHLKMEAKHTQALWDIQKAEEAIAALAGEDADSCPTCGRKYTEKLRAKLIGPLEDALRSAEAERDKLTKSLEDAGIKLAEIEKDYTDKATAARQAEQARVKAESDISAMKRQLAEIPDTSDIPCPDAIAKQVEAITTRIENGQAKLEALHKWADLKSAEANLETAQAELQHLEWMVAQFRDGEFAKAMLSDSKGEFETALNEVLEPFDYQIQVVIEGKHVTVEMGKLGREGGVPVPLAQCSKAELVLAGWAVASAFGDKAPVALDDLDAMYGPTKTKFLAALKERTAAAPAIIAGAWTMGDVDLEPITRFLAPATVHWIDGEAQVEARKGAA